MAPIDSWRFLALSTLTLAVACGGPGEDQWPVPGLPGDTLAIEAETDAGEQAGEGVELADRQADRRAMEEVDAAFPHSAHRTVECQRCHQRPSGHATHRDQECRACHGQPEAFATLAALSPRECATCHHADPGQRPCRSCHAADDVGARPVLVAIKATGADEARVRRLTFDHADHQSRECLTCHTTSVTLQFGRECASCHEYHHRQDARCMTCHQDVETPVHTASVHAGCAGGGCHGDAPVLSLSPTRNVCQVCHQDRVDHNPGIECTVCHVGFGDSLRDRAAGGGR